MDKVSEIVDYLKKERDWCKFSMENTSYKTEFEDRYGMYALRSKLNFINDLLNKINAKEN